MNKLISFVLFSVCLTLSTAAHSEAVSAYADGPLKMRDSHGKWTFKTPPKRIAVINWTHTEQLLELGVKPVAIADIEGFKATSPQTEFKHTDIIDLKSRFSPDLIALKNTQPDLIIIGYSQRDLLRPLSNIAPVMYFNSFSRRFNNLEKADERFLLMAKLFDKETFAANKLQKRDEEISKIKTDLQQHFANNLPELTIASLDNKNAWVFSENSLPFSVAKLLGFKSVFTHDPTKLGAHKTSFTELEEANGCVLLLDIPNPKSKEKPSLNSNNTCLHTLEKLDPYGGAMSRLYLANAIKRIFLK